MPSQLVGAIIAVGLGFWAYSDAKRLRRRGIKVGNFSPVVWGFGVALFAIVFGVLYLRQRGRAMRAATEPSLATDDNRWVHRPPSPTAEGVQEGEAGGRERSCASCGHKVPPYVASFCPKCGRPL
jgi:zinc-ribbon domain